MLLSSVSIITQHLVRVDYTGISDDKGTQPLSGIGSEEIGKCRVSPLKMTLSQAFKKDLGLFQRSSAYSPSGASAWLSMTAEGFPLAPSLFTALTRSVFLPDARNHVQ